jgi:putative pyruvate formate lyase activating enzyme
MVVFSGCHLSCSFCYTPEASQLNLGENFTAEEFKNLLAKLLAEGARNINLISPTHTWSVIESVLEKFKEGAGKKIPLLLKFSGFESPALIRRFARLADILIPDFKVWSPQSAKSVSLPIRYGIVALSAIEEMGKTHGRLIRDSEKIRRGILTRHLLMPGFDVDSLSVIRALKSVSYQGVLNLMTCFIEPGGSLRKASPKRVEQLIHFTHELGISILVDGKNITLPRSHAMLAGSSSA